MPTRFDVVVLGSGIAGTAAAIAAANSGARACVITGAPGATALFAGAWRGICPDGLRSALAQIGYLLERCASPLPHPYGHLVDCSLAPPSHQTAQLVDGTIAIGVAGLPGFDAAMLARQWSARAGTRVNSATIEVPNTPASGWSPVALAGQIDRQPETLAEPLARALQSFGAQRAILPAILGIGHGDTTRHDISSSVDCVISEALGAPPSLPGWRLHNALRLCLNAAGVAIFDSKGLASARRNGRIEEIELMNGDVVAGRSFVLATGKYAAGGIEADADFREPALGCPVWVEHLGESFEAVDPLLLTHADRSEEQPLLAAGVHTNDDYNPVNSSHGVVYDNVFVAGSIRAGWSVTSHAMGDAAIDGWNAGLKASA